MARQIGSGRTGVHEILRNRRFPGKVLERRATIDDDPEVHLARAIETDHPVTQQVTQEIQELRENMKVECDECSHM